MGRLNDQLAGGEGDLRLLSGLDIGVAPLVGGTHLDDRGVALAGHDASAAGLDPELNADRFGGFEAAHW